MRLTPSFRASLRSPLGITTFILWTVFLLLALIAPSVWGHDAVTINVDDANLGRSWNHLLGTDQLGRDVLARTLTATRLSLELTAITVLLAAMLGIGVGATVGVLGRRSAAFTSAFVKLTQTFPAVLVAIFVVTIVGPGEFGVVIAIAIAIAPQFARTSQALAASVAESDYMAAARVIGVRRQRLLRRYILPNTAEPLVLQTATAAAATLVTIAAFSYLGLGVQLPQFDWGAILAQGLPRIYTNPLEALAPGFAITLAGIAFILLGETVARGFNPQLEPRLRRRKAAERSLETTPKPAVAAGGDSPTVLSVKNFRAAFVRSGELVDAVAGVDLSIGPGEIVGIVGESGSGKSMLCLGIAGLAPHTATITADRLEFLGRDTRTMSKSEQRALLGSQEAVIFQDPMSSLNPSVRVGVQVSEKARVHMNVSRKGATDLAIERLRETQIPSPDQRMRQYPHEFSGGMRQRAMIAMGLITSPALIIADEPTTALDVTVQAEILELLREINREHGTAILFVSHDIAVVSEICSRIIVMYAGRIVEEIPTTNLAQGLAQHPYTKALMSTVVDLDTDRSAALAMIPGRPPALGEVQGGCAFAPRCASAFARCQTETPQLEPRDESRVACWAVASESAENDTCAMRTRRTKSG